MKRSHTCRQRLARVAAIAAATAALAACNSQSLDGSYKGLGSAVFGLVQYATVMTIKGNEVEIALADQKFPKMSVQRDGDRFVVYEKSPADGITFNVGNNGNTLTCGQCEALHLPRTWEKQL